MKRSDFIEQSKDFIDWLGNRLDTPNSLKHSWVSLHSPIGIRKGEIWACENLYSAYTGYVWKSKNRRTRRFIKHFNETAGYLEEISSDLTKILDSQQCDRESLLRFCVEVLDWGGVNKPKIAKLLRNPVLDLDKYLNAVRQYFNNIDDLSDGKFEVEIDERSYPIELDSGTTKIYSLICDNFVIYDSRVGAALAMLVMNWANFDTSMIPDHLAFPWGKAQTDKSILSSRRNPDSVRASIFLELNSGRVGTDKRHHRIKYNVYANWLLTELAERNSRFREAGKDRKLRAIEAALFMIGYTVRNIEVKKAKKKKAVEKAAIAQQPTRINTAEIRKEVLNYLQEYCQKGNKVKFTSSKIKSMLRNLKNREADLTTVCQAINNVDWFKERGFGIEIMTAPKKGLGRVTYRSTKLDETE